MDRLTAMQVFVKVAELGSQSAAAEQLELSRPVVSRCLAELENWLGARLMNRSTRKLSLTDAGQRCLEQCKIMLEQSIQLQAEVNAKSVPAGLLRINCSAALAHARLLPLLTEFLQAWPLIKIDLQLQDKSVNLVEQGVDIALRTTSELDPNLIAHPLAPCRSLLCASEAYLQKHGRPQTVYDLAHHNCLSHNYFGKNIWEFKIDEQMHYVSVNGNLTTNDAYSLLLATLSGNGIALLPDFLAQEPVHAGLLQHLLPHAEPKVLQIYAVLASRRHLPPAVKTLIAFLRQGMQT